MCHTDIAIPGDIKSWGKREGKNWEIAAAIEKNQKNAEH